jgi:hypothetical protein
MSALLYDDLVLLWRLQHQIAGGWKADICFLRFYRKEAEGSSGEATNSPGKVRGFHIQSLQKTSPTLPLRLPANPTAPKEGAQSGLTVQAGTEAGF